MNAAITPRVDVTGRREMRKYTSQALKPANVLQRIVDDFVDAQFNAPEHISYEVIYEVFSERWQKACAAITKKQLGMVELNPAFFEYHFKPAV